MVGIVVYFYHLSGNVCSFNLSSCSCLGKVNEQPAVPCWFSDTRASDVSCREEQFSDIQEGTLEIVREGCIRE